MQQSNPMGILMQFQWIAFGKFIQLWPSLFFLFEQLHFSFTNLCVKVWFVYLLWVVKSTNKSVVFALYISYLKPNSNSKLFFRKISITDNHSVANAPVCLHLSCSFRIASRLIFMILLLSTSVTWKDTINQSFESEWWPFDREGTLVSHFFVYATQRRLPSLGPRERHLF